MQESDFYDTYHFSLYIDNVRILNVPNHRPELFEDVAVYFSDKYYPPADAYIKNMYACQGKVNVQLFLVEKLPLKSWA